MSMKRRDFLKAASVTLGTLAFSPLGSQRNINFPATGRPARLPNIVLVIADALRDDHMSAYGYSQPTTPNIVSWMANQGVTFQQATSAASWTVPGNASIMTGRSPARFGASWDLLDVPAGVKMLAEYLHDAGYYNAAFVSAPFIRGSYGFNRGFDIYDEAAIPHLTSQAGIAEKVNGRAAAWLQTNWPTVSQPLFLLLYYFDPHTWYNPLPPYDTRYDPTYTGTFTGAVYKDGQEVQTGTIDPPTPRDVEHLLALYDGEITYWDVYLGQMFADLQTRGVLDNTSLLILTADHADMFGEHGKWSHGNCVYEEVLRVPLLMRYPGVIPPNTMVNQPVQSMDLMPTILDWVGIPMPADLQAKSVRALAQGNTAAAWDIFSETEGVSDPAHWAYWQAPRVPLRAVRRGDWKLIHHVSQPDTDELYQLNAASLYETTNQIAAEPARAQELRQAIVDWYGLHTSYLPLVAH